MVIIKKQDRVDYIVNGICNFYGITLAELRKRYKTPALANRKRIAIKLLHDMADIKFQEIALILSLGEIKTPTASWISYQYISDLLDKDSTGNTDVKEEYKNLLNSLGL